VRERASARATERELVVVAAVLEAGSEKAAAHRLGLSYSTVKHHLANARFKVGATTTAQLVWILAERLPEPQGVHTVGPRFRGTEVGARLGSRRGQSVDAPLASTSAGGFRRCVKRLACQIARRVVRPWRVARQRASAGGMGPPRGTVCPYGAAGGTTTFGR
jgi:DNA-binding CsgD family transcriptional regulator